MTDLVSFGEGVMRLSPQGHERLETAQNLTVRAGGSAAATAVAAERLGAMTTWMTKLPDSPLGHRVHDGFAGKGIETEVVWSETGRQGTYYLEHANSPRGTDVIYDLEGSAFADSSVNEFDLDLIRQARGFYVTGITPAVSEATRETCANLLGVARQSGTTVALDVNYRSNLWGPTAAHETLTQLFPAIDVLIVAARDARNVLGYQNDPPQIAHQIAADYDFTTVVVTREERGALAWHDSVVHEHDGYSADTVDPVGAGDTFSGAFVARRLAGDEIREALDYATAAAALKRTIPGDIPTVSREEVEMVMAEQMDGIAR